MMQADSGASGPTAATMSPHQFMGKDLPTEKWDNLN
jgi:hypothetical protein